MLKKYFYKILFCLTTLGITSLQAAHLLQQEGKNDLQETAIPPEPTPGYYNHTLKHSKKPIDNIVEPEELAEEQQDLKETHIAEKLKNNKGAIFFMVIVSNTQTEERRKFFFFNRAPNREQDVVWKVQKSHQCHVISHHKPRLSPHIVFQVLGWLVQVQNKYVPLFIHASAPVCGTCKAIISNFFNLTLLSNEKGCNGGSSVDLEKTCPLAQQYIKKKVNLPLAKKLLLPTLCLTYEKKLKRLESEHGKLKQDLILLKKAEQKTTKLLRANNKQVDSLKSLLKARIGLPYSPLKGHTSNINSVVVTSDNKYIVSGSGYPENAIRIWDFKTGKEVKHSPLTGHISSVWSLAISQDNKYIVSGSHDNTIRIWNFKTGKERSFSPLKAHIWSVMSVALTHDNRYIVSSSTDNTIRICDIKTGKELLYSPLKGHTHWVRSVAVTTDNRYIVSGSEDKTICIWDSKTNKQVNYSPLKGHADDVRSVAVTGDNKYIVSGSWDKTIRIWDLKTGKELPYSPLKGHTHTVSSVAVAHDNQYIVSGSLDTTIRIWDLKTGKELSYSPLNGHTNWVYSVTITSDNKYIVSGSVDNTIRIWDFKLLRYLNEEEDKEAEQKEDNEVDNEVFDID